MYGSDHTWAMLGVEQKTASVSLGASDDSVAAKKL
jgi:hypothetical protein